jgi:hypothetical protein
MERRFISLTAKAWMEEQIAKYLPLMRVFEG